MTEDELFAALEADARRPSIEKCAALGSHLEDVDDDGYCNLCGEQGVPEELVRVLWGIPNGVVLHGAQMFMQRQYLIPPSTLGKIQWLLDGHATLD